MSRLLDRRAFRPRAPRRGRRLPPRAPVASGAETSTSAPPIPFKAPPRTCTSAASEARAVLRALREGAASGDASVPRRVRVELPFPPADRDTDDLVYLGLHGQAADWSGGMQQRFRVTKGYVEDAMLDGYDHEYLGLLDRDADGMGVWRVGENMTAVAHPSDVTVGFFLRLLRGEYGDAVPQPSHVVVVVNAFWSGNGERVGQPWEFGLKREAREVLGRDGDWDKVYCCRRARSAAGVEGTLVRSWPGPWRLYDARGTRVVLETETEPSNRAMGEALNEAAGAREAAGFNRDAAECSRDDDCIT